MNKITAIRHHDISCGHRVVNHESKCRHLHGHNYRIHFHCSSPELDDVGRVIDFGVIKEKLCMWTENNWDHKMLIWEKDPLLPALLQLDPASIVVVPFNPTAENMAKYLVEKVGVEQLPKNILLHKVSIEETMKCRAEYKLCEK